MVKKNITKTVCWAIFTIVFLVLLGQFIYDWFNTPEPINYVSPQERCLSIGLNEFEGTLNGAYKFSLKNFGAVKSYGNIKITSDNFVFRENNKSYYNTTYSLSVSNNPGTTQFVMNYDIKLKLKEDNEDIQNATINIEIPCRKKIWFLYKPCEESVLKWVCNYKRQGRLIFVSED